MKALHVLLVLAVIYETHFPGRVADVIVATVMAVTILAFWWQLILALGLAKQGTE